ncbi:C40 family peptidase [Steroidobacter sp. S1-65]|uniref:C40 family peptidase n=1 Tax=Steroidobacter gossypii TaxID=2805490 RepID=A0ABS1WRN2_9GAMM|nr:C40 family peptidase [Steroidobacter gossypii]MBM0103622.1 C40 family peptidase [Steroidobacter gossypii]
MNRFTAPTFSFALLAVIVTLQGCAVPQPYVPQTPTATEVRPPVAPATTVGNEVAIRAISLLGSPYEWGGNGPTTFDCSGLVRFIHDQLGILVPRTAAEQYSAATPVDVDEIEPGDLLFFKIKGRISHVAIYAGEGRFVHAPQTGRSVELRMLDDDFYAPRLAGAGRLF